MTRVIAGTAGGRPLAVPDGRRTRPTGDRVKEALFSSLGDLTDAVVLDLFAGTGGLGIESLSRGAARAVFVEQDRRAVATVCAVRVALHAVNPFMSLKSTDADGVQSTTRSPCSSRSSADAGSIAHSSASASSRRCSVTRACFTLATVASNCARSRTNRSVATPAAKANSST